MLLGAVFCLIGIQSLLSKLIANVHLLDFVHFSFENIFSNISTAKYWWVHDSDFDQASSSHGGIYTIKILDGGLLACHVADESLLIET